MQEYIAITDKDESGHAELEDYRPIDPVPGSKASIRPRPIQDGTLLMLYIPKPSPPLVCVEGYILCRLLSVGVFNQDVCH
ncbi:hypothetical protein ACH5RR_003920 [Cinchona calisaya]|uniref:Uncharacterized protein n=1 Tax=Cinchona calisaya TaxID=153742 RepID=A0ABD3AWU5_9GENT